MIGMVRDAQFGPSVMFGLGGIFTEILQDVSFRVAPVRKRDALDMMAAIRAHRILDGVRGMKPVERHVMAQAIMALGRIGLDFPEISEIDVNPMIIRGSRPVAVDGFIVLGE
jgi:acetyl-CoA synthetase (ADP-forming)